MKNGYLVVRDVLSKAELLALQAAADEVCSPNFQRPTEWQRDYKYGALVGTEEGAEEYLCRLEYPLGKHPSFLKLAGNPRVIAIAHDLHRAPVVLTWEDMVVKSPGSPIAVTFHQDSLFQSDSMVFAIAVYLNDSETDPLYVYPGTHHLGALSEDEVAAYVRANNAEALAVPVHAGDAIIHNVRVIHGSRARPKNLRRVIYLEFRTPTQIREQSPWGDGWLYRRAAIVPNARRARAHGPEGKQDDPLLASKISALGTAVLPETPIRQDYLRVNHYDFSE